MDIRWLTTQAHPITNHHQSTTASQAVHVPNKLCARHFSSFLDTTRESVGVLTAVNMSTTRHQHLSVKVFDSATGWDCDCTCIEVPHHVHRLIIVKSGDCLLQPCLQQLAVGHECGHARL